MFQYIINLILYLVKLKANSIQFHLNYSHSHSKIVMFYPNYQVFSYE